MRNVFSKGFIEQLPELRERGFKGTELQIKDEEDLKRNPRVSDIEIYTMHEFKGAFKLGNRTLWGNIGDNHIFGDLSEKLLKEHVGYARKHNIPRLVLHPGFVNAFTSDKDAALDTVARRLENIYDPNVELCIENSEFRPDFTAYSNERLVVDADNVEALFRKSNVPLKLVADIEHLYVTAITKQFYEELKPLYQGAYNGNIAKDEVDRQAEEKITAFTRDEPEKAGKVISEFVNDYFQRLNDQIDGIHVCGSDPLNYRLPREKGKTLIGSHLPVGVDREIEGDHVRDRVDHKGYDSAANENAPIILEITSKGCPGDYVDWVAKSRDNLLDILSSD